MLKHVLLCSKCAARFPTPLTPPFPSPPAWLATLKPLSLALGNTDSLRRCRCPVWLGNENDVCLSQLVLVCPRLDDSRAQHAVQYAAQREHARRDREHHLPRLTRLLETQHNFIGLMSRSIGYKWVILGHIQSYIRHISSLLTYSLTFWNGVTLYTFPISSS